MDNLTFLKPLVADVLRDDHRRWTVQGFGFLRTYFGPPGQPKRFRLNLWDSAFTVPNVSVIHDHPWDFQSVIIAGEFRNQRYIMDMADKFAPQYSYTTIKTGEGGGLVREDTQVCGLTPKPREFYYQGDVYHQAACEIHETRFEDGTVTLNERVGDTEQARVFWPHGTNWVDAMPRPARDEEVQRAVNNSLARYF
jgi:hypothetical protein